MRLGIDFGTTRIVAAAADRGNYPVITFEDNDGRAREWFPPLIAASGNRRLYGWDAWSAQADPACTIVRSLKRTLEGAGPGTLVDLGGLHAPLTTLLAEMCEALHRALRAQSSLPAGAEEPLEIMLGVPANANSNQRFLTVDAFARAGFTVVGMLNEPSAASIEYGHRNRTQQESERVLVYDLGGGTFDASLVEISERVHTVVASEGVPFLGGDDFDILLADLALAAAGLDAADLSVGELFRLHDECRNRKESLHPNSRRILVDLSAVREDLEQISVPVGDFYDACQPLVDRSIAAAQGLLAASDSTARLEAVYVTGGGSELPLVPRALRDVFGRRVRRSPYTRSATAIGLAIQADAQSAYTLRDSFTRWFGVWREAEAGKSVAFDALFDKGISLPAPGEPPVVVSRAYCPAHNVGHFRYLECSHRAEDGRPVGDLTVWDEIRFPFDPALANVPDLAQVPVRRLEAAAEQCVEERYHCEASGAVTVTIANRTAGYERQYRLGRWAAEVDAVSPGRRRAHRHN